MSLLVCVDALRPSQPFLGMCGFKKGTFLGVWRFCGDSLGYDKTGLMPMF